LPQELHFALFTLQNENNSCSSRKVTNLKKHLGCFLFRVGDDDSGPEDTADDEDLECVKVKNDINKVRFYLLRAYLLGLILSGLHSLSAKI
jgi:hypothetical protein